MSENKMLEAYRHLLERSKEALIKAEMKSWDYLGQAVHSVENKGSVLEELTEEQLDQVRNDVQDDIHQMAEYLTDFNQGVEEFVLMDIAAIEAYLQEKAADLSDPTAITILRLRMQAAMSTEDTALSVDKEVSERQPSKNKVTLH